MRKRSKKKGRISVACVGQLTKLTGVQIAPTSCLRAAVEDATPCLEFTRNIFLIFRKEIYELKQKEMGVRGQDLQTGAKGEPVITSLDVVYTPCRRAQ